MATLQDDMRSTVFKGWANEVDRIEEQLTAERERADALAAHVERLTNNIVALIARNRIDGRDFHHIIKDTPKTSLAQRDAQVAAETYDELADDLEALDPQFDDCHYVSVSDMRGRAEELRCIGCRKKARASDDIAAGGSHD